jgi:hypothetical protein
MLKSLRSETIFIYIFQQNPVVTSLHLRSPVHVVLPQVLHNMVKSMPDRLQEVIQRGKNTTQN